VTKHAGTTAADGLPGRAGGAAGREPACSEFSNRERLAELGSQALDGNGFGNETRRNRGDDVERAVMA
jgi:hypothetical protein